MSNLSLINSLTMAIVIFSLATVFPLPIAAIVINVVHLILILAAVGLILWLINRYVPMAQPIKSILNVVVVILLLLWLLNVFGVFSTAVRVG